MKLQCITVAALLATTVAGQRGRLYTPKNEVTSGQGAATIAPQ